MRPPKGAGVHSSPMISVVTPWVTFESSRPSVSSGMIEWLWMSMKPGQTIIPAASITSPALAGSSCPAGAMTATLSPRSATSP